MRIKVQAKNILVVISLLAGIIFLYTAFFSISEGDINAKIIQAIRLYSIVIVGLSIYQIFKTKIIDILLSITIFNVFYLALEFGLFLYGRTETVYPALNAINKPNVHFNPKTGYKWDSNDTCRCVRIGENVVIFDNKFVTNNYGYVTHNEFYTQKQDAIKKRYMVLGDSFTAALFLESNWVDRVNELSQESGNDSIEFYPFGVDGGGVLNWHAIFFNEIVPEFHFDGVIIASFFDDLNRDLQIYNSENGSCIMTGFDSLPNQKKFIKQQKKQGRIAWEVKSDKEIDTFKKNKEVKLRSKRNEWTLSFVKRIAPLIIRAYYNFNHIRKYYKEDADINQLIHLFYPSHKINRLYEIIEYCKNNNKEVIITSIPNKESIGRDYVSKNQKSIQHIELSYIAKKYNTLYFDGFEVYDEFSKEEIDSYWLKYDGHWNQKGSDLYANSFARWFAQSKLNNQNL